MLIEAVSKEDSGGLIQGGDGDSCEDLEEVCEKLGSILRDLKGLS